MQRKFNNIQIETHLVFASWHFKIVFDISVNISINRRLQALKNFIWIPRTYKIYTMYVAYLN